MYIASLLTVPMVVLAIIFMFKMINRVKFEVKRLLLLFISIVLVLVSIVITFKMLNLNIERSNLGEPLTQISTIVKHFNHYSQSDYLAV